MKRIALFFCFIFSFAAHANNIIVNGTRFIYPGNEKEITVQLSKEGANKRGNSSRLTQSFHFFMFEPIFSPVNALNQPI